MTSVSVITCARAADDSINLAYSLHCLVQAGIKLEVKEQVAAKSIGAGYNQGIRESTSDILVFTHTDVTNWAAPHMWQDAFDLLTADENVGFVGVAGGDSLHADCAWWASQSKHGAVAHTSNGLTYTSFFGPYGQALVMDGVLLMCRRDLLERLDYFDESLGWHFYDIDITLRAHLAGFKNYVMPIPILHGSVGHVGDEWVMTRHKFIQKHRNHLPVSL